VPCPWQGCGVAVVTLELLSEDPAGSEPGRYHACLVDVPKDEEVPATPSSAKTVIGAAPLWPPWLCPRCCGSCRGSLNHNWCKHVLLWRRGHYDVLTAHCKGAGAAQILASRFCARLFLSGRLSGRKQLRLNGHCEPSLLAFWGWRPPPAPGAELADHWRGGRACIFWYLLV